MTFSLPERQPAQGDVILTPSKLAALNDVKRQAIDNAIRRGRIKAYRYPGSTRIWIHPHDVPSRYAPKPGGAEEPLTERLDAIEAELRALRAELQDLKETQPSTSTQANDMYHLRSENAVLAAVNQLLLAEAADRDDFEQARIRAFGHLQDALTEYERAETALKSSRAKYREALSQTQLPAGGPKHSGR